MKRVLAISVLAMLTGCATTQPGEPDTGSKILCGFGVCTKEVQTWMYDKMIESGKRECSRFGYKEGTPGFSQCLQTNVENQKNRMAAQRAAQAQEAESARRAAQQQIIVPTQPAAPRNYDCRQRLGGRIECTGY
jgi:hypothetical protein